MSNKCKICGKSDTFGHTCISKKERRIEAGRQANSGYRGDTPPTWSDRLKYGFSMIAMDGDDNISMRY